MQFILLLLLQLFNRRNITHKYSPAVYTDTAIMHRNYLNLIEMIFHFLQDILSIEECPLIHI